jgi:hypothetical protein
MDEKYVELAGRIGLGRSERIARLFGIIADADEAELLLALPGDAAALAEKLGRSQKEVTSMLRTLFVKGLVFPSGKTEPLTYRMSRDLVQFHDASILWPDAPREFLDLWQDFMEVEWPEVAKTFSKLMPRPFTRVIPVGVTVQARTHVLAFEDIKEIVGKARSISVSKCTCRLTARKCDKKLDACLQVNKAADYNIARGTGRKISPE